MESMGVSEPHQTDAREDVGRPLPEVTELEQRLARSDMLLRAVPDLICVMSPTGVYLDVYAPDASMLFAPRAQLLGSRVRDVLPPDVAYAIEACLRTASVTGKRQRFEYALPLAEATLYFEAEMIPDGPGRVLAFVRDVSERQRAAVRERATQQHYQALVDSIEGIVWEADATTFRFRYVSRQAERLLGYPVERWINDPNFRNEHLHPDDAAHAVNHHVASIAGGGPHAFEYRMLAADGRVVWLRDIVSVVLEDGRPSMLRGIMVDITDRRRTEEALQASEERLRQALAATHMGVWQWDFQHDKVEWSPDTQLLFGVAPGAFAGTSAAVFALIHDDDRAAVQAILQAAMTEPERDGVFELEFRRALPGGEVRWLAAKGRVRFDEGGTAIGMTGTVMDVSERRRLEGQLQQSQKMETVGRLAGGIAHDFNNLLTVIMGEVQLAQETLPEADPLRAQLASIASAGDRAAQLIGQLLAFARKQVFELKVVAPEALLRELEQLLRRLVGEDIELRTHFSAGLWPLQVDPHQIGQVVLNLAVNAREAMPVGGVLTLEADNVTLDADAIRGRPDALPGDYVLLAVSDTGVGMGRAAQEHLFEPFFTTKTKGTGLGLATSYGIVKQHGGHLWVHSEPGKGSTFRVYLPRAAASVTRPQPQARAKALLGAETVLVVEDDQQVRALNVRGLGGFGFKVLAAANGEEALALAASHPGPIHAVVTDVVMPNMSGPRLAEVLAKVRPEARFLFVSGYSETVISERGTLGKGQAFLQKPFTPTSLAQRLREVLDAE